ncbi:Uncharacterised protein [Vibrio cholerae]|nr:Uncharacterised protein [Vibrio cholerae]
MVNGVIDVLQILLITGAEIVSTCGGRDGLQCLFIQILRGIHLTTEQEIFDHHFTCTDADGINRGVVLFGDIGGFKRVKHSCGIAAITEQNHHALRRITVDKGFGRESNPFTNRGLSADKFKYRLIKLVSDGLSIQRQRRLQIGVIGKQDQSDTIAFALGDKFRQYLFDCS